MIWTKSRKTDAAAAQPNTDTPPPGYKLVSWAGVGLYVPERWDMGRHFGDHRFGGFRVDNEYRSVIHARWWKTRKPMSFEQTLKEHIPAYRPRKGIDAETPEIRQARHIELPAVEHGRAAAYETPIDPQGSKDVHELVVLWQDENNTRSVMWRILIQADDPDPDAIATMLAGLRLQGDDAWRDWAALEFRFQTPPGYEVFDTSLAAGVSWVRFARSRRTRAVLRRFSAVSTLTTDEPITMASIEKILRIVYAAEFYDMRYRFEPIQRPDGRRGVRLISTRGRRPAMGFDGLMPRLRSNPKQIDVLWDEPRNKLFCLELEHPKRMNEQQMLDVLDSAHMQLPPMALEDRPRSPVRQVREGRLPMSQRQRLRSLQARILRNDDAEHDLTEDGRVKLSYPVERRKRLRLLRWLSGTPAPQQYTRTTELDQVGSIIWDACERQIRVCDLVELTMQQLQISYREAELSITHYVQLLGRRGLIAVKMPTE